MMRLKVSNGREHVNSIITQTLSPHHGIWMVDFSVKYLEAWSGSNNLDGETIHFIEFRASDATPDRIERYDKDTLSIRFELEDVPISVDEEWNEIDLWVVTGYSSRYTGWIIATDTGFHQNVEILS